MSPRVAGILFALIGLVLARVAGVAGPTDIVRVDDYIGAPRALLPVTAFYTTSQCVRHVQRA